MDTTPDNLMKLQPYRRIASAVSLIASCLVLVATTAPAEVKAPPKTDQLKAVDRAAAASKAQEAAAKAAAAEKAAEKAAGAGKASDRAAVADKAAQAAEKASQAQKSAGKAAGAEKVSERAAAASKAQQAADKASLAQKAADKASVAEKVSERAAVADKAAQAADKASLAQKAAEKSSTAEKVSERAAVAGKAAQAADKASLAQKAADKASVAEKVSEGAAVAGKATQAVEKATLVEKVAEKSEAAEKVASRAALADKAENARKLSERAIRSKGAEADRAPGRTKEGQANPNIADLPSRKSADDGSTNQGPGSGKASAAPATATSKGKTASELKLSGKISDKVRAAIGVASIDTRRQAVSDAKDDNQQADPGGPTPDVPSTGGDPNQSREDALRALAPSKGGGKADAGSRFEAILGGGTEESNVSEQLTAGPGSNRPKDVAPGFESRDPAQVAAEAEQAGFGPGNRNPAKDGGSQLSGPLADSANANQGNRPPTSAGAGAVGSGLVSGQGDKEIMIVGSAVGVAKAAADVVRIVVTAAPAAVQGASVVPVVVGGAGSTMPVVAAVTAPVTTLGEATLSALAAGGTGTLATAAAGVATAAIGGLAIGTLIRIGADGLSKLFTGKDVVDNLVGDEDEPSKGASAGGGAGIPVDQNTSHIDVTASAAIGRQIAQSIRAGLTTAQGGSTDSQPTEDGVARGNTNVKIDTQRAKLGMIGQPVQPGEGETAGSPDSAFFNNSRGRGALTPTPDGSGGHSGPTREDDVAGKISGDPKPDMPLNRGNTESDDSDESSSSETGESSGSTSNDTDTSGSEGKE